MARAAEKEPINRKTYTRVNALFRSGVVLLNSHIEGFIEELGTIAVERIGSLGVNKSVLSDAFRYYFSDDLISVIKQSDNPGVISPRVQELFARDGHVWDTSLKYSLRLETDRFVRRFSTPRHNNIKSFFGRFGYDKFEQDMFQRLKATAVPCQNMVDQVVAQRNKIAHGDPLATGTPADLSDMVRLVKDYCRCTDQIVGDWFRGIGCPIR